jgi:hypothetical protein
MKCSVAALAALAIVVVLAGCGGSTKTVTVRTPATITTVTTSSTSPTTTTPSTIASTSTPSCASTLKASDIPPTLCLLSGTYLMAATDDHPLRLPGLTVEFVSARTASSLSASSGAASAQANGIFLIITLRITNTSNAPQTVEEPWSNRFQLSPITSNANYSESFQAEDGPDQQSFHHTRHDTSPTGRITDRRRHLRRAPLRHESHAPRRHHARLRDLRAGRDEHLEQQEHAPWNHGDLPPTPPGVRTARSSAVSRCP